MLSAVSDPDPEMDPRKVRIGLIVIVDRRGRGGRARRRHRRPVRAGDHVRRRRPRRRARVPAEPLAPPVAGCRSPDTPLGYGHGWLLDEQGRPAEAAAPHRGAGARAAADDRRGHLLHRRPHPGERHHERAAERGHRPPRRAPAPLRHRGGGGRRPRGRRQGGRGHRRDPDGWCDRDRHRAGAGAARPADHRHDLRVVRRQDREAPERARRRARDGELRHRQGGRHLRPRRRHSRRALRRRRQPRLRGAPPRRRPGAERPTRHARRHA